ncbi:MAG: hypothetical protein A2161_20860 [Candidatus Schekmanbacteria bacterium RBG_13_48_7]|uniref:HTH merR-type domain-containing protein n=1 Tax=Candidatus Schekmanbacteria bacterium RBG_13_48_7 TaxID=1817878 RepID=A0A1F7RTK5_9BACT|nr:MAG: hypothetical protein A2161_20860 [Candidatus Schekmanbacteria bacterium RBG_13_48_7]
MKVEKRNKAPAKRLFYRIGEVSKVTGLEDYILRYWESEFKALAPLKNKAGQRIYTQEDVDLILKIRELLYKDKYTIAGAKKEIARKISRKRTVKTQIDNQLAFELENDEAIAIRETLETVKQELNDILNLLRV